MADDALFIGWGSVVRGRERKVVDAFGGEALAQQMGRFQEAAGALG